MLMRNQPIGRPERATGLDFTKPETPVESAFVEAFNERPPARVVRTSTNSPRSKNTKTKMDACASTTISPDPQLVQHRLCLAEFEKNVLVLTEEG